ncbi:MAG: hypothetical protein JST12_09865 [Armatimonadetes bacterium]|nr:hypothetical protein [Armatimonadota bacterium]
MNLSRRDVLVGASAMTLSGIVMGQNNPQKRLVVGSGEHTYEVYHDWIQPPMNLAWGDTHGVTTDAQGHIYIAHTVGSGSISKDTICVYDQKGKFIRSFGSEFAGGAHGLDLRKEGSEEYLYICDVNRHVVAKSDLNGRILWEFGAPKESGKYDKGEAWNPTNVAFAPNGDFFVGDGYGSSYIHRYNKDGQYLRTIIGPGSDPGQVKCPHGLWVDDRDKDNKMLVVADRSNNRLQYFTLEGTHIKFVKDPVRQPCHIHFNHDLMLVPDLACRVTILDGKNEAVAQLGDGQGDGELRGAPREKFVPGHFVHPHGAAWINKRDIVVVEWVPQGRITLLKRV